MFWCHGGGFATGSGSSPVTEGANLAKRGDVVVVTINHRLNVLGFTSLEEAGGPEFASSGDAGMLDIVVRARSGCATTSRSSAAIPDNVMVFGQSGGGRKVATLLAMPSAKGLFHRATIESGATLKLVEPDSGHACRARADVDARDREGQGARAAERAARSRLMAAYFEVVRRMNVDQMTQGFSPLVDGTDHPAASVPSGGVERSRPMCR